MNVNVIVRFDNIKRVQISSNDRKIHINSGQENNSHLITFYSKIVQNDFIYSNGNESLVTSFYAREKMKTNLIKP